MNAVGDCFMRLTSGALQMTWTQEILSSQPPALLIQASAARGAGGGGGRRSQEALKFFGTFLRLNGESISRAFVMVILFNNQSEGNNYMQGGKGALPEQWLRSNRIY